MENKIDKYTNNYNKETQMRDNTNAFDANSSEIKGQISED